MARTYTFPHAEIRTKDESAATRTTQLEYPVHRPLMFICAERGEPFVPKWVSEAPAVDHFGEETFNRYGKYYGPGQLFLDKAIFPNQACFVVRLVSPDAQAATVVVECQVKQGAVTQYQRDANGGLVKDASGNPIPLKDGANNVIQEAGVVLKYTARPLAEGEKHKYLKPRTVVVDGVQTTFYPIASAQASSPGAYGDKTGLSLFYDYTAQDVDLIDATGAIAFTFAPVQQTQGSNIATAVRDVWGSQTQDMLMKPNQVDKRTDLRISWDDKLGTNYVHGDSKLLPYDVHFYAESFETIGNLVRAVETNDPNLTSPWMVDILSGENLDGYPYHHVQLDTSSSGALTMNENFVIYLSGGSDGDISWDMHQTLIQQYLNLEHYPEIRDNMRYPFTHIYDVGYNLETKYAITKFLSVRDDFKAILSTQDITKDLNTMEEDQSAGSAIRGRALLQPESLFHGTGCCRAEIFQEAGYLNDPAWKQIVPATLWSAIKRAQLQSKTYVTGMAKGYPEHLIDIFREYNWAHYDPDRKQLSWDTGLNYFQHYDMNRLFYADVGTVYQYDTSVLRDTTFTDCLIYMKYILRGTWAKFAGMTVPIASLFQRIEEDAEKEAYRVFGNLFPVTVKAWQSIEEAKEGDIVHLTTTVTGYGPFRKLVTDLVCQRENYNTTTTTTTKTTA